jgi:hypothetical protein
MALLADFGTKNDRPMSQTSNVALVTPPKSATFRDIRDIWSTPFLLPIGFNLLPTTSEFMSFYCYIPRPV